ncbi:MAG: hypothetical protein Q8Q15_02840, partial [bacterium]|nr:hypothetical protein [bacterium]
VSLATTMPEILVSLFASATRHTSLALGNVVGSGLVNLGLLLGIIFLSGKISEPQVEQGRRRSLILFGLILFVSFWFLVVGKINFYGGLILIAFAFAFLIYTFRYALRESGDSLSFIENTIEGNYKVVFKFLLGAFLLVGGARFLVDSAINLSPLFGMPEIVVGLVLVAIGTSLPELILAAIALFSGHTKISMGNLTGATVLTFTLALGIAATVTEVKIEPGMLNLELLMLVFFAGISVLLTFFPRLPKRLFGGTLILGYIFYLVTLF